MKILILSRKPEIYSARRLVEEITARGHVYEIANPEEIPKSVLPKPVDLLIPRLGQFRYPQALKGLQTYALEHPQVDILNPPEAFHRGRHKKISWQLLHQAGLPQPDIFAEPQHFPLVIKDCLSGQGEGVFLCQSHPDWRTLQARFPLQEFLFQEWIRESFGHDVRVFIIGQKIIAAMERRAQDPREFRSNLSLGGIGHPATLSKAEAEICLQAVQVLELDYAGVDFVRSHRGPLILEVNPCPGLEGIEKYTSENIAKELVVYAEGRISSHS